MFGTTIAHEKEVAFPCLLSRNKQMEQIKDLMQNMVWHDGRQTTVLGRLSLS